MNFRKSGLTLTSKSINRNPDKNESFILIKCAEYLRQHLRRHLVFNTETVQMVCWILGSEMLHIQAFLLPNLPDIYRKEFSNEFSEAENDPCEYAEVVVKLLKKLNARILRKFGKLVLSLLESRIRSLGNLGKSEIDSNFSSLKQMFNLTEKEKELCTLLFIIQTYEEPESFFQDHLYCNKFRGHKFLRNILGFNQHELNSSFQKLKRISVIDENFTDEVVIEDDILGYIQNPKSDVFSKQFYARVPNNCLPLDYHFYSEDKINHVLKLLSKKSKTSTHIIFYGPPGTGKTSFAHGVAEKLVSSTYEITRDDQNESKNRRAALVACLNMANSGKGSLVIVDEADNMLNTMGSWFMRGETQDKGWLNQILEEPGARVIWITNSINNIEDSVLRRFSFSLHFKTFNRRQRIQLWENIIRKNKVKRFFNQTDIEKLARKYRVSAGAIDLAIKKSIEINSCSRREIQKSVDLALDAHQTLHNFGKKQINKEKIEENYSLDGLNIHSDFGSTMDQIRKFDDFLRSADDERKLNMNLLFYGAPGTGKSELARYIAKQIDREIICKRVSDLHNMYVGETEKNIKRAFEEAEAEEAILIIDEAESLLFSRDRAQRSWEISFTNEFLTQMERFRGILICTTNRLKDLDGASIRRFNNKIKFDFLEPEGNVIFYYKLLGHLISTPLNTEIKNSLRSIEGLSPGDFKTVRDRYEFYSRKEINHQIFVQALSEEARTKNSHKGIRNIGF